MFRMGGWEIVILLVIVLIIFGVGRLPEIGGAIGRGIREFREQRGESEEKGKDSTAAAKVSNQS